MEALILVALIIAGLLLFATEVFLIPGFGLAGLGSAACLLYGIYYAFNTIGTQAGIITLVASAAGIIAVIAWFMRSKTIDKLSLKKTLDYQPDPLKDTGLKPGDTGISLTSLKLVGNIEVKGHIVEAQSADGFIDERTPIRITRITDGTVYVERCP